MAEKQATPKDPIQTRSMSLPIFVATGLLLASLFLAMYDEFIWRRPYKKYQEAYVNVYANYLEYGLMKKQQAALDVITARPEYKAFERQLERAKVDETAPIEAIQVEIDRVAGNISVMSEAFKDARALFAALTYKFESARTQAEKDAIWDQMTGVKTKNYPVSLVRADGSIDQQSPDFDGLSKLLTEAKDEKGQLERKKADTSKESRRIQKNMDEIVAKNLIGPRPEAIRQIMRLTDDRKVGPAKTPMGFDLPVLPNGDIIQINISEANWVDRCESCHTGIREPIPMSWQDLMKETDGLSEDMARAFVSHPSKVLLEVHDPDNFGCSTCHNGNGRSTSKVSLAHGLNKHWLYPLFHAENVEAGCVQCHRSDIHLRIPGNPAKPETKVGYDAKVFNEGRWLFQWKGCVGCHRYEGYDTELEQLTSVEKERNGLVTRRDQLGLQKSRLEDMTMAGAIDQEVAGIDTKLAQLDHLASDLLVERQKVGPDLTYIRAKLGDANMSWLPAWIENPHAFRPSTKMPKFRYEPGDVEAIAAYLWQNSDKPAAPKHPMGDPAKGRTLFDNRGCLACHTVQRDGQSVGDGFAADLSRMGDKAEYDYIVEWVKHPTNGVMPSLRLSDADAQNIAAYLMSLGTGKPSYQGMSSTELATKLNDKALAAQGKSHLRHFGCAGCHTIKGLEEEGRIGTELTKEGSVPKERLDFGRKEHDFKMSGRYSHKYFFETKLATPAFFGDGKHYDNVRDKLKMPSFWPAEYMSADPQHEAVAPNEEINALTTFLLGSVEAFRADSQIPDSLKYKPSDKRKAIQEGWWIVKKYNCIGCHQFEGDVTPSLWKLENFQNKLSNGGDPKPPTLVGQGFRTNPNWLASFLRNPALSTTNLDRNGVRSYLEARMPTFRMSDREIAKLVKFFDALSSQSEPYQPPVLAPLSASELDVARGVFKTVQCFNCHARGAADPEYDLKNANAPLLTHVGARLKPDWTMRWLEKPSFLAPGTQMPAVFHWETMVEFDDGRSQLVLDYTVDEESGQVKALDPKTYDPITFKVATVKMTTPVRMVIVGSKAAPLPANISGYAGDHRQLMTRYLQMVYTESEIPNTLPPK